MLYRLWRSDLILHGVAVIEFWKKLCRNWCFVAYRGYRVLVGKPGARRPLGRPRRRWVDNIRMDLHEVGCGYMDWIGLAQDRDRCRTLVSAVMNLRVLWNAGISWLATNQLAFQEWLSTMEWVSEYSGYSIMNGRQRNATNSQIWWK